MESCPRGMPSTVTGLLGRRSGLNDGFGSTMPMCSRCLRMRQTRVMRFFADPDQFEQIGPIPLAYNRAILLMAQAFHGTGETFGDRPETGWLSQPFEFSAA